MRLHLKKVEEFRKVLEAKNNALLMSFKNVNNVLIWHLKSKKTGGKILSHFRKTSSRFYVI
jgi:predicted metal-binding protein